MSLLAPPRADPARARDRRRLREDSAFGAVWRLLAIGAAVVLPLAAAAGETPPAVTQEYDLKAAFLFNFAHFVDWPADAFKAADSPITIGVLGEDPFGKSLDEIVAGETARNRPLVIRRYRSIEELDACHILFISNSETIHMDHILKTIGRRSILTVGEGKGFTARSGMIGFMVSQRRLRLRINLAAATGAGLTISSKLLRQAELVRWQGVPE